MEAPKHADPQEIFWFIRKNNHEMGLNETVGKTANTCWLVIVIVRSP